MRYIVTLFLLVLAGCESTRCEQRCEELRESCGVPDDYYVNPCTEGAACPLEDECSDYAQCEATCYSCRRREGLCDSDSAESWDSPCVSVCDCYGRYGKHYDECHPDSE